MLAYGRAGSGKTWFVRSLCDIDATAPVLVLNASGNPLVMRYFNAKPDIIDITALPDFNWPFHFLENGQPFEHPLVKKFGLRFGGKTPYKTVVVDQISDVQEIAFNRILGTNKQKIGDMPIKREWDHYNSVMRWADKFARRFFSLPMHVIFTALEQYREGGVQEAEGWHPALEGRARQNIPGAANMVCRIVQLGSVSPSVVRDYKKKHREEPKHNIAFFVPHKRYDAKDQLTNGRLTELADLTMTKLNSYLEL